MTIFNEIYGKYFRITGKLLSMEKVTKKAVNKVILCDGFRDSMLFLPQKLLPQKDGSDWGFFVEGKEGQLVSVLSGKPVNVMTMLQKRWLAAKINDPKMKLFLDSDTLSGLREALADVKPLYGAELFRFTDQFNDGDDFSNEGYIRNFRRIISAIRRNELLKITFVTERNETKYFRCLPMKLEYSLKNDRFRLHCKIMSNGRLKSNTTINLGRITAVRSTGEIISKPQDIAKYYDKRKAAEPVTVRVTNERNAVERFLTEFAAYEKHTVRDLETGECTTQLFYDRSDETELLVQLLSFGPVLEILGPEHFRELAAERIRMQYELLFK